MEDRKSVERLKALTDSLYHTTFLVMTMAVVNWVAEKTLKNSFSEDPSKSASNFIKWSANVSISKLILGYINI